MLTHEEQRQWSHGFLWSLVTAVLMILTFGCSGSSSGSPGPSPIQGPSAAELTGAYEGTLNGNHLELWLSELNSTELTGGFTTVGPGPINVNVRGNVSGEMLMLSETTTSSVPGEWEFWATIEEHRISGAYINTVTGENGVWEVTR
jgi:hypothetical protein